MPFVFTSVAVAANNTASSTFIENGNPNQAACPVSAANIISVPPTYSSEYALFKDSIGHAAASVLLKKTVSTNETYAAISADRAEISMIFPPPPVVTSFESSNREIIATNMANLGFSKESTSGATYYKGPASREAIIAINRLGGRSDTKAPYGASNIRGYLAFIAIQKLIIAATAAIRTPVLPKEKYELPFNINPEDMSVEYQGQDVNRFAITSADDVKHSGLFLPYFNGLTIPDKDHAVHFIVENFQGALGATRTECLKASATLREGWRSVATSGAGLILSHAVYCFDTAIKAGAKPVFLVIGGVYQGTILFGKGLSVMKANTVFSSVSRSELTKEVKLFNTHDAAVQDLADLLCTIAPRAGATELISPIHLNTPRRLHEHLRVRSLTPAQTEQVRGLLKKTKYNVTLWTLSDNEHLLAAFEALTKRVFISDAAPMLCGEAVLTKDPLLSTLACFGARAPSLVGKGANISFPIRRGQTYVEKFDGKTLQGIPIFIKPLQEAYEDWKTLHLTGNIFFKAGGTDRMGYTKIPDCSKYWDLRDSWSNTLQSLLARHMSDSAKAGEKKRKRKDAETGPTKEQEEARGKRARVLAQEEPDIFNMFFTNISLGGVMPEEDLPPAPPAPAPKGEKGATSSSKDVEAGDEEEMEE